MSGERIIMNCRLKARLIGGRNLRAFLRGDADHSGPPWMDIADAEIAKAFDRLLERNPTTGDKP